MDSDKVLVMDVGQAVEFDHPHKLLQTDGYFTKMLKEMGEKMEMKLRMVAEEDYNKKYITDEQNTSNLNDQTDVQNNVSDLNDQNKEQ